MTSRPARFDGVRYEDLEHATAEEITAHLASAVPPAPRPTLHGAHVAPYAAGNDWWHTAYNGTEYRMHSRYQGRSTRFTLLFIGPNGVGRLVQDGPAVPGPRASLVAGATVIAAHRTGPQPHIVDLAVGDRIRIRGYLFEVRDDRPHSDPGLYLVEEETSPGKLGLEVQVWGPNLGVAGEEAIHVHAAGCRDTLRGAYRSFALFPGNEPAVERFASQRDVVEVIHAPADFEYDADLAWGDFAGDVRFFPCVDALPAETPAQAEASARRVAELKAERVALTLELGRLVLGHQVGERLVEIAGRLVQLGRLLP